MIPEEIVFFKAILEWTWQEYEGRIEENRVYIEWELIWVVDNEDFSQDTKQQLESILLLSNYNLEEIYSPEEIYPFYYS